MWIPSKQTRRHVEQFLDLPATGREQDWEIELSDHRRIGDFLEKYTEEFLDEETKIAICAILIASFNDSLVNRCFSKNDWLFFVELTIDKLSVIEESGLLDIWNCRNTEDNYEICKYLNIYLPI
ncbi:hypothetical protein HW511_09165 [Asaia siamensis]|uniref:hypothetical protein n=1 Tax=Asaia siamensis TaxID=110479 RepID=UPI00166E8DF5|nr:hypothetical protein [Asaia siamensis]GBR02839.1 hypothetical protein AA0323_0106 [Asaia siamensis NRIC 0323]